MKNTLSLLAGGLVLGTMLIWQSCSDPCKDVVCQNGGTPTEADKECNCVCATGYEGTSCETEMRAKFIGSFKYNESTATGCGGFTDWPVTIATSSSDVSKVLISGFGAFACGGADIVVEATVDGSNVTVVANQTFSCTPTLTIKSGSGSISGNVITISSYTYNDGTSDVTCSGTYTKQ